jgi:hypothetical protein
MIEKHGVDHNFKMKSSLNARKKTWTKKYGVDIQAVIMSTSIENSQINAITRIINATIKIVTTSIVLFSFDLFFFLIF